MDAQTAEKLTYAIAISDGGWSREIEVEADADGLYLEGAIIPWEWIDSARRRVLPSCEEEPPPKPAPCPALLIVNH